jgi:hypothetical protein
MSESDHYEGDLDEDEQLLDPLTDEAEDDPTAEAGSKACQDYMTRIALEGAPRNQDQYLDLEHHTRLAPNPILAQQRAAFAGDRELASKPVDPIALRCCGVPITYVVWHWCLFLTSFWKRKECGGSKTGQPPCPNCYDQRCQEQQQQQQQAQQAVTLQKWDKDKCGTVTSHGWSQPAQRYVNMTGQEGYMLVQQYRCRGCPGMCWGMLGDLCCG